MNFWNCLRKGFEECIESPQEEPYPYHKKPIEQDETLNPINNDLDSTKNNI